MKVPKNVQEYKEQIRLEKYRYSLQIEAIKFFVQWDQFWTSWNCFREDDQCEIWEMDEDLEWVQQQLWEIMAVMEL